MKPGRAIHGSSLSKRALFPELSNLDHVDRGTGYPAKLWRPKLDLIRKTKGCGFIDTQRGTPVIQANLEPKETTETEFSFCREDLIKCRSTFPHHKAINGQNMHRRHRADCHPRVVYMVKLVTLPKCSMVCFRRVQTFAPILEFRDD